MEQQYSIGTYVSFKMQESIEIGKILAYDCGEYIVENSENGRKSNVIANNIIEQV